MAWEILALAAASVSLIPPLIDVINKFILRNSPKKVNHPVVFMIKDESGTEIRVSGDISDSELLNHLLREISSSPNKGEKDIVIHVQKTEA